MHPIALKPVRRHSTIRGTLVSGGGVDPSSMIHGRRPTWTVRSTGCIRDRRFMTLTTAGEDQAGVVGGNQEGIAECTVVVLFPI